jgi:hypothetical protein
MQATRETLNKSFDKAPLSNVEGLRTNGNVLVSFMVSLSNHRGQPFDFAQDRLVERSPERSRRTRSKPTCSGLPKGIYSFRRGLA